MLLPTLALVEDGSLGPGVHKACTVCGSTGQDGRLPSHHPPSASPATLLSRLRSEQDLLCHPTQPRGARGNLTGCPRRRSCRSHLVRVRVRVRVRVSCRSHLAGRGAKAGSARRGEARPSGLSPGSYSGFESVGSGLGLGLGLAVTHRSRRSHQRASSAR